MELFDIREIRPGVYCILDQDESSFYLVEGAERAAVIDTGVTKGETIMPMLRKLTQKPMVLILTHAHIDHFYHMDEFDTVYMSHREMYLPWEFLKQMMDGKNLDLASTTHIETGSTVDLGGRILEICDIGGHTPGSVAIYDRQDDLLFTGDAIGSGCGVWMQLPGSLPLHQYEQNLRTFMLWLLERGGRMEFWGGHSNQYRESAQIPGFNPLSMGLLADLADLAGRVLQGQEQGRVMELPADVRNREARYAAYGRAEMLFDPDNL